MIITLTTENFKEETANATPILVDFWATWCPPCMMQGEVLHSLAEAHPNLRIGKVNVDENPQLAVAFGVENIPTMMLFKDGRCMETLVGLRQAAALLELFRKYGGTV